MNFTEFYLNEDIGIDNPKPPIKLFKKVFMSWEEKVRIQFAIAVNAWHGTTVYDNNPELLIRFSKEHPKEMLQYQEWLKSLVDSNVITLYRGFYGKFAEELAEKIWIAIKNKTPFIEIELKEYNSWTTNIDVARKFSDAIIIKYDWNIDNIFHADAGRGFLRQTEYANYVKLKRTEREIVIKYTGKIKIDPVKDVIFRGKYRSRQLKLNKKELQQRLIDFQNKLEIGKTYLPKQDIKLPPFWQDILEKGGIVYLGLDDGKMKFRWPDGIERTTIDYKWLETFLDFGE